MQLTESTKAELNPLHPGPRPLLKANQRRTPNHEPKHLELDFCPLKLRALHRHRLLGAGKEHQGILRRRPRRADRAQRNGHRRGLDERGVLHGHGRIDFRHGLYRLNVSDRLDRRLRAPRHAAGPLPAQIRQIHRA